MSFCEVSVYHEYFGSTIKQDSGTDFLLRYLPTRAPLSMIDGANRFLVTVAGTVSESNVLR